MDAQIPVIIAGDAHEEQIIIPYEALTPSVIEDEKAQSYIEALNFACSRPDIRNIAVTGPYGAGKSSVLLTWEKAEDNEFRVMTVSLADFEMQQTYSGSTGTGEIKSDGDSTDKKAAKAEEKTIEYSILQQLLYKEKKSVLPYSRLERISDVSPRQIAIMAASLILILVLAATGLLFLFPGDIGARLSLPPDLSQCLLSLPALVRMGGAGVFLFSSLFLALQKLHRTGVFDRRVNIDKVDVLKGAISTRPTTPSLLNVYLDEIVYFFEQTQYNIVIFEDLDRHNDGAIFIKLREINQLINNCLPADKPVRFIYAVRDNLFSTPESRTKFFDFVMPVIPVMDSENAFEHFSDKFTVEELKQEGFRECLARLAIFIPDLRVMHNIANEFRLYRNIVNNGEDLKRLVSLITYKNICAEDYHGIDLKKGVLYSIVVEYTSGKLRDNYCDNLKSMVEHYQSELSQLRSERVLTEQELRGEILHPYISDKTSPALNFTTQNGTAYSFENIVSDENAFILLLNHYPIYIRPKGQSTLIAMIDQKTVGDMKDKYEERLATFRKKSDVGMAQLEAQIAHLSHKIQKSFSCDLAFFINEIGRTDFGLRASGCVSVSQKDAVALPDNTSQTDFLYFLLSHGYLSSDYMSYRSVFMPGSLSTEDNNFVRAVTAGRTPGETAKIPLSNIANTVVKLRGLGMLMQDSAWHPQVLWHLMHNDKAPLKTIMGMQIEIGSERRMIRLANETFIRWNVNGQQTYLQLMVAGEGHLSMVIDQIGRLNDTAAEHALLPLLLSLPALSWITVSRNSRDELQRLIDAHFNLVTALPPNSAQTFCVNLRNSQCHLTHIPLIESDSARGIVRTVVQEKLWAYTTFNLLNICLSLTYDVTDNIEVLRKKPVATIKSLRIPSLVNCVYENLSSFIRDIFIHSEESEAIPELLNSTMVGWEDIEYLTANMDFILDDVTIIHNKEAITNKTAIIHHQHNIYSLLAYYNHLAPSWENTIALLDEGADVPADILCGWLNKNSNTLNGDLLSLSASVFSQLLVSVVSSEHISKEALAVITRTFWLSLIVIPENLPLNNVEILVAQRWLAPTAAVFEQLYQAFYQDGERLTQLLYSLVCTRPALLRENYDLVLYIEKDFDRDLAVLLLNGEKISDADCISTLNWLWERDEALFSAGPLVSLQTLAKLSAGLTNERQKQALLIQCLKNKNVPHTAIRSVLMTFEHPDYAAFLIERSYRSIMYSDTMWQLAILLERQEYISAPKLTHNNTRIRIEPFRPSDAAGDVPCE